MRFLKFTLMLTLLFATTTAFSQLAFPGDCMKGVATELMPGSDVLCNTKIEKGEWILVSKEKPPTKAVYGEKTVRKLVKPEETVFEDPDCACCATGIDEKYETVTEEYVITEAKPAVPAVYEWRVTQQAETIIIKTQVVKRPAKFVPCSQVCETGGGDGEIFDVDVSSTDETCSASGTKDGTASASYLPEFKCQWSTGETTSTIKGLGAGMYSVTVSSPTAEVVKMIRVNDANICR